MHSDDEMAQATAELLADAELLSRIQAHDRHTDPAMTWERVVAEHLDAYQAQVSLRALSLTSAP